MPHEKHEQVCLSLPKVLCHRLKAARKLALADIGEETMLGKMNVSHDLGVACALVALLAFAAPPTVLASVIFSASAGSCAHDGAAGAACFQEVSRAPPASADTSTAVGNALSTPSGIGSSAQAFGSVPAGTSTAVPQGPSMASGASFTLDDVIISGPSQATSVDASLNVLAHYSIFSQTNAVSGIDFDQYSQTAGNSTLTVSGGNSDLGFFFSNTVSLGRKVDSTGQLFLIFDISGDFPSVTAQQLLDGVLLGTPDFTVPLNTEISLGMSIGTTVGLTLSVPVTCNVPPCATPQVPTASGGTEISGIDTFGFPTDGPVFNLPQGFTANSATGLIVNNRWVIPDIGPVNPVPEPGTLVLFTASMLGMQMIRRRRRQAD